MRLSRAAGRQLRAPVVPPGRRLDTAGRLLVRTLSANPPPTSEELAPWSAQLVDWAVGQGVTGLFHRAAVDRLAPPASDRLTELLLADASRHLRALLALGRVAEVFDAAGLAWAAVKGPVLVETVYAGTARPYFDLDLLVEPSRFTAALEILEAAGANLIDRNWDLLIREGRAQVSLIDGPTGLTMDLHWHLVNLGQSRRTFAVPTEELLDRRVRLQMQSVTAPALEPTDRLMHYALHAATSGGHRLVWLADLTRSMGRDEPDWDELVRRCRRWRTGLPVAVMLARAARTLGAAVPAGVVTDLAGGPGSRWLVDRLATWDPGGRLPGGGSIRHGLTQSLGGSITATSRLTARNGARMVQRRWDRYPHWLDPEDPAHIEHDAGGAAGRERYLTGVASGSV